MKKSLSTLGVAVLALSLSAPAMAVSCKSFSNQAQAQQYFNAKKAGYKKLDRDRDGIACESNRGGSKSFAKSGKFKKGKAMDKQRVKR